VSQTRNHFSGNNKTGRKSMRTRQRRSCACVGIVISVLPAFSQVDLLRDGNWEVLTIKPPAHELTISRRGFTRFAALQIQIEPFLSETAGKFAVGVLLKRRLDLSDKTLVTDAVWLAPSRTTFVTRSTIEGNVGAYIRYVISDITVRPDFAALIYNGNDYWFSRCTLDLNASRSGSLVVSLAPKRINACGKSAEDIQAPWLDCVTELPNGVSPAAGFLRTMRNVNELGLAFGNSSVYASGVVLSGTPVASTIVITNFTIVP
jgi:hypothetical protein